MRVTEFLAGFLAWGSQSNGAARNGAKDSVRSNDGLSTTVGQMPDVREVGDLRPPVSEFYRLSGLGEKWMQRFSAAVSSRCAAIACAASDGNFLTAVVDGVTDLGNGVIQAGFEVLGGRRPIDEVLVDSLSRAGELEFNREVLIDIADLTKSLMERGGDYLCAVNAIGDEFARYLRPNLSSAQAKVVLTLKVAYLMALANNAVDAYRKGDVDRLILNTLPFVGQILGEVDRGAQGALRKVNILLGVLSRDPVSATASTLASTVLPQVVGDGLDFVAENREMSTEDRRFMGEVLEYTLGLVSESLEAGHQAVSSNVDGSEANSSIFTSSDVSSAVLPVGAALIAMHPRVPQSVRVASSGLALGLTYMPTAMAQSMSRPPAMPTSGSPLEPVVSNLTGLPVYNLVSNDGVSGLSPSTIGQSFGVQYRFNNTLQVVMLGSNGPSSNVYVLGDSANGEMTDVVSDSLGNDTKSYMYTQGDTTYVQAVSLNNSVASEAVPLALLLSGNKAYAALRDGHLVVEKTEELVVRYFATDGALLNEMALANTTDAAALSLDLAVSPAEDTVQVLYKHGQDCMVRSINVSDPISLSAGPEVPVAEGALGIDGEFVGSDYVVTTLNGTHVVAAAVSNTTVSPIGSLPFPALGSHNLMVFPSGRMAASTFAFSPYSGQVLVGQVSWSGVSLIDNYNGASAINGGVLISASADGSRILRSELLYLDDGTLELSFGVYDPSGYLFATVDTGMDSAASFAISGPLAELGAMAFIRHGGQYRVVHPFALPKPELESSSAALPMPTPSPNATQTPAVSTGAPNSTATATASSSNPTDGASEAPSSGGSGLPVMPIAAGGGGFLLLAVSYLLWRRFHRQSADLEGGQFLRNDVPMQMMDNPLGPDAPPFADAVLMRNPGYNGNNRAAGAQAAFLWQNPGYQFGDLQFQVNERYGGINAAYFEVSPHTRQRVSYPSSNVVDAYESSADLRQKIENFDMLKHVQNKRRGAYNCYLYWLSQKDSLMPGKQAEYIRKAPTIDANLHGLNRNDFQGNEDFYLAAVAGWCLFMDRQHASENIYGDIASVAYAEAAVPPAIYENPINFQKYPGTTQEIYAQEGEMTVFVHHAPESASHNPVGTWKMVLYKDGEFEELPDLKCRQLLATKKIDLTNEAIARNFRIDGPGMLFKDLRNSGAGGADASDV